MPEMEDPAMARTLRPPAIRRLTSWLLLGVMLAGCATAAPRSVTSPYTADVSAPTRQPDSPAVTVLNVLVTPLYFAFKVAVCGATVAIGAPLTGLAALTDPYGDGWQRQTLATGFAANCGPPYTLF
jgi:hypothetical protein